MLDHQFIQGSGGNAPVAFFASVLNFHRAESKIE
jgi:hypothetical protein